MAENRGGDKKPDPTFDVERIFLLESQYKDPLSLIQRVEPALEKAFETAFVVLDASVLLAPYEFDTQPLAEVASLYEKIASDNRLVVPARSLREFHKNKLRKLADIDKSLSEAADRSIDEIFGKGISFFEGVPKYEMAKQSARQLKDQLNAVRADVQNNMDDRVTEAYRQSLSGSIVELEWDDAKKAQQAAIWLTRKKNKIAPGFLDDKADTGIGDYLIWQTVLQEGASRKQHCILATNEKKDDWWVKNAANTFRVRSDLAEEYSNASGGQSIYLVSLSQLLTLQRVDPEVVARVEHAEEAPSQTNSQTYKFELASAAARKLMMWNTNSTLNRIREDKSRLNHSLTVFQRADLRGVLDSQGRDSMESVRDQLSSLSKREYELMRELEELGRDSNEGDES
ncbi:PIN-like domain-containing protein [Sphingomonas kyungheensis]|uniref:PIN domain-containing protein n=1 Tax=Sphingomonas kyungheensis TaxID=1069987 RepID=A0ABU8H5Y2_9SPHN